MNRVIFFIIIAIALFSLILTISGCFSNTKDHPQPESEQPEIKRVVSFSPNLTQIVYALGAQDLLVGVDEYSVYPEAAKSIPRMGSYLDPDLEALIAANPDLVLVLKTDESISNDLLSLGFRFEEFGNDNLNDIQASYIRLGKLLDREDEAQELASRFTRTADEVESKLSGVEPRTVALVVGRNLGRMQDIYVAGGGNFLGELLEVAGGENVFKNEPIPWPQVGAESLIGTDPDVIIDSTLAKGSSDEEYAALLKDWDQLPTLKALKNDRVIIARDGWFQIPGAYIDSTLLLFAHWLHPEIFPDMPEDPN